MEEDVRFDERYVATTRVGCNLAMVHAVAISHFTSAAYCENKFEVAPQPRCDLQMLSLNRRSVMQMRGDLL